MVPDPTLTSVQTLPVRHGSSHRMVPDQRLTLVQGLPFSHGSSYRMLPDPTLTSVQSLPVRHGSSHRMWPRVDSLPGFRTMPDQSSRPGYQLRRPGVQPSMTGPPYCCHVTLLILLLVLKLTLANVQSSSSSFVTSPSSVQSSSLSTVTPPSSVQSSSRSPLPHSSELSSKRAAALDPRVQVVSLVKTDPKKTPVEPQEVPLTGAMSQANTDASRSNRLQKGSDISHTSLNTPIAANSSYSLKTTFLNLMNTKTMSPLPTSSISLLATKNMSPSATQSISLLSTSSISTLATSITSSSSDSAKSLKSGQPENTVSKRLKFRLTASNKDKEKLKAMEKLFLQNMGLQSRPRPDSDFLVPEFMMELYQQQVQSRHRNRHRRHVQVLGAGDLAGNTVRSFHHTETESGQCQPPLCSRLDFDVSTVPEQESLTGAELRIFSDTITDSVLAGAQPSHVPGAVQASQNSTSPSGSSSYRIEIHEIMRPGADQEAAISRLLDTGAVPADTAAWHTFDVRPAVTRWRRGQNYGLEIRLVPKVPAASAERHIRLRRSAEAVDQDWALRRPLLVLYTDDGTAPTSSPAARVRRFLKLKRRKRQVPEEDKKTKRRNKNKNKRKPPKRKKKKGNKNTCKRHSLYVDFNDVGWDDWIVAPTGYNAYYCHGDCMAPLPHFTKASNHAMLQARVYTVNPGAVPMVCCVPSKMSTISMLYRDEKGRTVLKNYQDMSVEECHCK